MLLILLTGILFICAGVLFSQRIEVTFHHIYSEKMKNEATVRLVVLADLHNKEFGEKNKDLIELVEALKPDAIIMAGDMVDKNREDTSVVTNLCKNLLNIAPIYYGLGNHEGTMIYENGIRLDHLLRDEGVMVLINEAVETEIKGEKFLIGSVGTAPDGYEKYAASFMKEFEKYDGFKLLISHMPSLYYDKLKYAQIDLGICGHFHGGQIRIPFLGGLYSLEYGLFPQYCAGMYELEYGKIFVSRGLGSSHKLPRINNRPEVAVIDINNRKQED